MSTRSGAALEGLGVVLAAPGPDDAGGGVLAAATAVASAAARAGGRSLWVEEASAGPSGRVPYEAFSLLGALSQRTEGIRLGVAVDAAQRRAPSILAKIVTGIDVLSTGRALLALDGDTRRDGDADRLAEALAVARAVLEDDVPTVDGRIYHVAGAVNRPAPVQAGGVPLVVFVDGTGTGRDALLEVAARAADAVVVDGGPAGVRSALERMDAVRGDRLPSAGRPTVLGRAELGAGTVDLLAALRHEGADGCLVGVPAPWRAGALEAVELSW